MSQKKVPTFKLSELCQIITDFQNFYTAEKRMKFDTKRMTLPTSPRHVATLPWEIKNQIFCRYSADMKENANKLHLCTNFNSSRPTCVTVYGKCIYVLTEYFKY